jgi:hypothetical protein
LFICSNYLTAPGPTLLSVATAQRIGINLFLRSLFNMGYSLFIS